MIRATPLYYDNKSGVENRMSKMIFKTPNKLVTNFVYILKVRLIDNYSNENENSTWPIPERECRIVK